MSLLALPACGPSIAEPNDADDPRVPDGGTPSNVESSCRAFYEASLVCYMDAGDSYGSSGGYGSSGAYGSTGSYDPGDIADYYCSMLAQYGEEYGEACLGAMEEVFACIASLDCETLLQAESFSAEPCTAVYRDANRRCPELFTACTSYGSGTGCNLEASGCLDGSSYALKCSQAGTTRSCICEKDEQEVRTITLRGAQDCYGSEFGEEAAAACGFPEGTF